MRVVYVLGPYRANSRKARDQYVRRALEAMTTIWRMGGAPVCPSLSALGMGEFVSFETQVASGREILRRSDYVYVCGPKSNAEVRADLAAAKRAGLQVFTSESLLELRDALTESQPD